MIRQSFACDLETIERLAAFEREYCERYFLPVAQARRGAIHREHIDHDLASTPLGRSHKE